MDENVKQFRQIAEYLCQQYEKKNNDYGNSFGRSFEKYGLISALTRISDKFNRLEQMVMNGEQMVIDESVLDTLGDMASYCMMTILELGRVAEVVEEEEVEAPVAEEGEQEEEHKVGYLHGKKKKKDHLTREQKRKHKKESERFCPTCRHHINGECEAMKNGLPCVWTLDETKTQPKNK